MQNYHKVVLALGSNLGDKRKYLNDAVNSIHNTVGFVTEISSVYETPAWGFESFPFYNICISIHTHLEPQQLLAVLKDIEQNLGRTSKSESGIYTARTVDIDIIYFAETIFKNEILTIPHPQIQNRKFVLAPLNDLTIEWKHPILNKTTKELLLSCEDTSVINKTAEKIVLNNYLDFSHINFIAIEGNIGAGKTTLTNKISKDFTAKPILERFADNPFLPKFYEDQGRYAFPLEMSFLADRYSQLNEGLGQYDLFNDFVIADYYIYKSLIFAQVTLDTDEVVLYRTIFDVMYKETTKPDLYVYLYQSTENLLSNIQKRGRSYEEKIPATYLNDINNSYSEFIKTLSQDHVLVIDVTEKDFVENHSDYMDILSKIDKKIKQVR